MKVLTIAWIALRRLLRDRQGLFFVLLFPIIITVLISFAIFREQNQPLKVGLINQSDGPLASQLEDALKDSEALRVTGFTDRGELEESVRRDSVAGGIVIPKNYDEDLSSVAGAQILFLPSPKAGSPQAVQAQVTSVISGQGTLVRAALFASQTGSGSVEQNIERAARLQPRDAGRISVSSELVGTLDEDTEYAGFNYPSASNMVLFMFITSLTAASQLIEARRQGISRRMLATPTSPTQVILGTALGRFVIALFQGLFIIGVSAVAFGVDWGDPVGAAALVLSFCLVSTGVAILFGSILKTPEQAGLGVPIGIAMGMLGGTMWPLEIVPTGMRAAGHVTPHAWAMDGFISLLRGSPASEVITEVTVLLGFAVILLAISIRMFRRRITQGAG